MHKSLRVNELQPDTGLPRLIVLTTDFGDIDGYVGVLKGVILSINPQAALIDLTHSILPQNLIQCSFVLGTSAHYFPPKSIHVIVVDPGVGTDRDLLLLETPDATFIAPDNGVLSEILSKNDSSYQARATGYFQVPSNCEAYVLTESEVWLKPVSNTFHGRDILAPVAAHVSLGMPASQLGRKVDSVFFLSTPIPTCEAEMIRGQVINIDHFGNLITNITKDLLVNSSKLQVHIKGTKIPELSTNFAGGLGSKLSPGLVSLIGSHGYLEIAVKNGNAAKILSVDVGEPVLVRTDWPG